VPVWEDQTTALVTGREGHREVSRGHSTSLMRIIGWEGPNLLMQGAAQDTQRIWSGSKGTVERRCAPANLAKAEPELNRTRSRKHLRR